MVTIDKYFLSRRSIRGRLFCCLTRNIVVKSPTHQTGLWALVLIVVVAALTLIALNTLITDGARSQNLTLTFMALITLVVNGILNHVKTQKTLDVSESTDKKVNELSETPQRITALEDRVTGMESTLTKIAAKLLKD